MLVEKGTVRIVKEGSIFAAQREKTFPVRNISSVEVKKPGVFWVGYIQLSIAGGAVRDSSLKLSGGAVDAAQDENSVIFADPRAYQTALQIKEYIETYRESPQSAAPPVASAADEILKLKMLMDQGIISRSEFEAKKRRLLDS